MGDDVEKVSLCQETVNPEEKLGPSDFDLLKVLGKGGYGKVKKSEICLIFQYSKYIFQVFVQGF